FTSGSWQWTYHGGETHSIGYEADLRQPGQETATLIYTRGRPPEAEDLRYGVQLDATVPHFGGLRWWFICPLVVRGVPCSRRVGRLSLPGGARYFACRRCYDLTYTSTQEARKGDAMLGRIGAGLGMSLRDVKRSLKRRWKG